MDVSVVIPARNEEKTIIPLVAGILEKCKCQPTIVVVDDQCTDSTCDRVTAMMGLSEKVFLVHTLPSKCGFGNAVRLGLARAELLGADMAIVMMADCSDEIEDIDRMRNIMNRVSKVGVITASRNRVAGKRIGAPWLQSKLSQFVSLMSQELLGLYSSDATNAFKAYRIAAIRDLKTSSNGFALSYEMLLKIRFAKWEEGETATIWTGRKEGKSKFKFMKQAPEYAYWFLWGLKKRWLK